MSEETTEMTEVEETETIEEIWRELIFDAVETDSVEVMARLREKFVAARALVSVFNKALEIVKDADPETWEDVEKIVLRDTSGENQGRPKLTAAEKLANLRKK